MLLQIRRRTGDKTSTLVHAGRTTNGKQFNLREIERLAAREMRERPGDVFILALPESR